MASPGGRLAGSGVVVVEEGETLWTLAQRLGVPWRLLQLENNINSDVICPGEVLFVPPRPSSSSVVVVKERETLWTLAQRLNVPWRLLQQVNNLQSDLIVTGEVLFVPPQPSSSSESSCLPSSSGAATASLASTPCSGPGLAASSVAVSLAKPVALPAASLRPPRSADPPSAPTRRGRTKAVVVEPGDSAWKISVRFGLTLEELRESNGSVPDVLYPGDLVLIPEEAVEVGRRWPGLDVARPEAEFQGLKSSGRSFDGTPTHLSPEEREVQKVQHIAGSYPNHSVQAGGRRGLALIVSVETDRSGGAVDRGRLQGLLEFLKFETEIVVDDPEEIKEVLRQVVKVRELADDDCFLCCINAHGGIEVDGREYIIISGAGEKLYVVDDILKPITESSFLADKPKVFLINACRGRGWLTTSKKAEDSEIESSQVASKRAGEIRALHSVGDCLIVFSTSHGQESFRDVKEGTHFITALMAAIVHGSQTADVLSILTSVIRRVREMENKIQDQAGKPPKKKFQCPEVYTTLTRGLYWSLP